MENNLIPNCPVTRRDIIAAEHIFGPDVGALKGKTTRRWPIGVGLYNHTPIPSAIVKQYHDVILAVDILYINKLPFIATISRYIHFRTVVFLHNQKQPCSLNTSNKSIGCTDNEDFVQSTHSWMGNSNHFAGILQGWEYNLILCPMTNTSPKSNAKSEP